MPFIKLDEDKRYLRTEGQYVVIYDDLAFVT